MQYGDKTPFLESCKIQLRVIWALLLREIITRYGRKNIGFLWLFVEPLIFTFVIVSMWAFVRAAKFSDLNIVAFVMTGYPLVMMWRNASRRAMGAVSSNMSLLYHRNVRVLDTLVTRVILEVFGATVAFLAISSVFIFLKWMPAPDDVFYMLLAWGLMALFALGLGLILSAVAFYFEPFAKIWGTLSILMMPLSGAFFLVNSMPPKTQELLLMLPMVNATEMFRHGYFGSSIVTLEDPIYILICDLVMILFGLLLVKKYSKKVQA